MSTAERQNETMSNEPQLVSDTRERAEAPEQVEAPEHDASPEPGEASPIVAAPAGSFRGVREGAARVWRGIRYAQPPTGELRWRAPVAAEDLDGIVDALEFGPVCPQPHNPTVRLPEGVRFDEDCLFLNVWAPAEGAAGAETAGAEAAGAETQGSAEAAETAPPADPLPVMVWLHGGAYLYGAGSQSLYDGSALVVDGVLVVTLNYRLGAFGFLDLSRCGEPGEFDSNLALRDVLLALEWVQRNIAAFGGDPERVTVFGESAGGGLVTTLLAVPRAEGLFQRAIAQSSPASSVYGEERAFRAARRFLTALGVSVGDAGELREPGAGVDELVRASARVFAEIPAEAPGTIAFAPVVDGDLVPEAPITVLREGRGLPVPLIIGTNRNEASVFKFMKSPLMPVSDEQIREMLEDIAQERPELQVPEIGQIRTAYEGVRRQAIGLGIGRDIAFRLPTLWIAEGHCAVAPVWLYRFDYTTPLLRLSGLGATHASEVAYVWRRLEDPAMEFPFKLGGRRHAATVSARMSGRWLSFAKGGAPEAPGAHEWPRYELDDRPSLVIDAEDRVATGLDTELRQGWGDEVLAFP